MLRDRAESEAGSNPPAFLPGSPEAILGSHLAPPAAGKEPEQEPESPGDAEVQWYRARIAVERQVKGRPAQTRRARFRFRPGKITDLQQAFDAEWTGLLIVKLLFVIVVALLITARLT